jgi:hypothetical protein
MVKLFRALLQFGLAEAFAACFYGVPVVFFSEWYFPLQLYHKNDKANAYRNCKCMHSSLCIFFS